MPSGQRRPARAKRLIRTFVKFQTWRDSYTRHRQRQEQAQGRVSVPSFKALLQRLRNRRRDTSDSSGTESVLQNSGNEGDGLGQELKSRIQRPASLSSLSSVSDAAMADIEDFSSDDDDMDISSDSEEASLPKSSQSIRQEIEEMYASRYESGRDRIPRMTQSFLHHVLLTLKNGRADIFRQELRVSPFTFDQLVGAIEGDEVFQNHSETSHQAPVEEQLAVVLYRFGHDGNGAGLQGVSNWAGIGKGTVLCYTKRVLTALLRPEFMQKAVRLPTEGEKEEAKQWVEDHSCRAWRNGWCFVDGTLVPLYARPYWYGESYFDRKCRYSLNIQIVNLPNLRIIDFSYGHVGSTHDSTAWEGTRVYAEHEQLFPNGEWIWADSAYPIQTWVIAPFKKPERDEPDNAVFNNQVSNLRIRSEHCIGFLKGRFQSLKNLRVNISDKNSHQMATLWIAACIAVHTFAMQCEMEERDDDDWDVMQDPFIAEGLDDSSSDEDANLIGPVRGQRTSQARLQAARAKRTKLKEKLFKEKERRAQRREAYYFG